MAIHIAFSASRRTVLRLGFRHDAQLTSYLSQMTMIRVREMKTSLQEWCRNYQLQTHHLTKKKGKRPEIKVVVVKMLSHS